MRRPFDPLALLNRLLSTYWFVPALVTAGSAGLAFGLLAIDRADPGATSWLGWAYSGGAAGARALLTAVAGSMITVVSVTFSVLVVALTVSSQHFGPRLLANFMRDTSAQLVLGAFTGTYVFCLVVLRTVEGEAAGRELFVPHLAVTMAVVMTLGSVGMLIYYVHHVAMSMQVSEITAQVAREFERTVRRLYPEPFGEGSEPPAREPPPVPPGAEVFASRRSGYLQEIDDDGLFALAGDHDVTVWLCARPGDFVVEGVPVAAVHPPPRGRERLADRLAGTFVIGSDRTPYQDAAFAVQQLVEVALRALSPGVNEPFTAITCVERLGQGLAKLLGRRIPSAARVDDEGNTRVVARPRTFVELVGPAFEPVALYAGRNPEVGEALSATLRMLARAARRPEDRDAIGRTAENVWAAVGEAVDPRYRERLAKRFAEVQRAVAGAPDPQQVAPVV